VADRLRDDQRRGEQRLHAPLTDPQLTQHKRVRRQLVWMNGPQLFPGPELGDRAEPRVTTSATLNVKTHRGVWSSTEAQ